MSRAGLPVIALTRVTLDFAARFRRVAGRWPGGRRPLPCFARRGWGPRPAPVLQWERASWPAGAYRGV